MRIKLNIDKFASIAHKYGSYSSSSIHYQTRKFATFAPIEIFIKDTIFIDCFTLSLKKLIFMCNNKFQMFQM